MVRFNSLVCMLLAVTVLSGCATFKGDLLAPVEQFPTPEKHRPSVSIDIKYRNYFNDMPMSMMSKMTERGFEKQCVKRFEKSGLFDQVGINIPHPDIDIVIDFHQYDQGSLGMAFLTGLTFYLVPSFSSSTYKLKAEVTDHATGEKKVVELEDYYTMCQQLFLLPIAPFTLLPVVSNNIQNNIFDTLAIKALEVHNQSVSKTNGTDKIKNIN